MQSRKDLVQEAQMIINDYIKRREVERVMSQFDASNEYLKSQRFSQKRINFRKVLDYLLLLSLIIFVNSVIYLIFFLNFHK